MTDVGFLGALRGGGEMGRRIREHDWRTSPLGPMSDWPSSLTTSLALVLSHPVPMVLAWGPELITLYNDAYRPLLGAKPEALGRPLMKVWGEARDIIAPQIAKAQAGEASSYENARFIVLRGSEPEEAFFDYSYSPVFDETGAVAGVVNTAIEITGRVLVERRQANTASALRAGQERQAFLLALGDAMRAQPSAQAIIEAAGRLLGERLEPSRVVFAEFDETSGTFMVFHAWLADGATPFPTVVRQDDFDGPHLEGLHAGRTLRVDDAGDPPFARPDLAALANVGIKAALSVPLIIGGRLMATLSLHQHTPRRWTDDEVSLLQEVAERLWADIVRVRAEAALRESEEKFRTLFESIDEGFCILELIEDDTGTVVDFRYIEANEEHDRQAGLGFVVGKLASEVVPNAEAYWFETFGEVARTGQPKRYENYNRDTAHWYNVYVSRVGGPGSRRVCVVSHDSTERKRAEAAQADEFRNTKILQDLGARLVTEENIQTIYEEVLTAAIEITGAKAGTVQMLDPEPEELIMLATRGFSQRTMDYFERVDASSNTSCGLALRTGERSYFDFDADSSDHAVRLHVEDGVLSAQSSPLVSRSGKPIGMVSTHWGEGGHRPSERELRFLDLLARQAADLLEQRTASAALRVSEERQAFLLRLSDALRAERDPQAVGQLAVDMLARHMGVDRCYVARSTPEGLGWVGPEHHAPELAPMSGEYLVDRDFPEAMRRLGPEPLIIHDLWSDPKLSERDKSSIAALGMEALFVGALRRGKEFFWGLAVGTRLPRAWTDADRMLIEETADRTWAAMERAGAGIALQESERALAADLAGTELLRNLADRLVTEENSGAIYDEVLAAAINIAQADAGTIQIYEPETKTLEIIASRNFSRTITDYFHHVDASSRTACGIAMNTGERAFVDFPDEVADLGCRLLVDEGLQSALALPLVSRTGKPLGMLNTHWRAARHRPSDKQLRFLELIARQAADLIEQRQAQSVLRESEERLRAAFSISTVGVMFWNPNGALVDMNDAFLRMTDFSREEALGRTWHELTPPEFQARSAQFVEEVERTGEGTPYEKQYFRKDGSRWWGLFTARKNGDGLVEFVLDISDRRDAEVRLQESEERLRRFGEVSQDILWMRDAETLQWQYLTPAFETIYGLSREEALSGNTYRNWLDLIVPEDRAIAIDATRRVREGEHVTFDYRIQRLSDGTIRWLRNTDFPLANEAGEITLIGGIGHDLTEIRETELRLQTLLEGIPQLVWRSASEGLWSWSSPQWQAFTGQSLEQSLGLGWLDAVHPDDREPAMRAWEGATPRGVLDVEYRVRRAADGAFLWHHTRSLPVRDEAGGIAEWLGTTTDVQQLKALQERQGVMVAELQHRTRNLITVVGAVSKQTLREAASLSDFGTRFNDRLTALSRVQGLLSHLSAGQRVTFDQLLGSELAALGAPQDKVTLDGPENVSLRSAIVQTFALALHELATNALKYGALAASGGHLSVRWRLVGRDAASRLQVEWIETGVDMTDVGDRPRGGGYGRELIERALPYQLGAETTYELTPLGVRCTIDVAATAAST